MNQQETATNIWELCSSGWHAAQKPRTAQFSSTPWRKPEISQPIFVRKKLLPYV